jgi:hypothetical protein
VCVTVKLCEVGKVPSLGRRRMLGEREGKNPKTFILDSFE